MSSFTRATFTPAGRTNAAGRPLYVADQAFEYDVGFLGSGLAVKVDQGFVTDLASLPAFSLPVLGRFLQDLAVPAAVHDRLRGDVRFSLTAGNALFLCAMRDAGLPVWVQWTCFLGVSLNRDRRV